MEAKEREEDDGGADGLAEVRGLVGVRGTEFGHQDAEYVHEETRVRQDAQKACKGRQNELNQLKLYLVS